MSDQSPRYDGTCLCRAVSYTVTGNPITMVLCHCENCQKFTGASFMSNYFFKNSQFTLLAGAAKIKDYHDTDVEAGGTVVRSFCGDCGSSVYCRNAGNPLFSDAIVIPSGMLDRESRERFRPEAQFFCRNAQGWIRGRVEGAPEMQGMT